MKIISNLNNEMNMPVSIITEMNIAKKIFEKNQINKSVEEIIWKSGIDGLRGFNNNKPFTDLDLGIIDDEFVKDMKSKGIHEKVIVGSKTLASMFGISSSTVIAHSYQGKKFYLAEVGKGSSSVIDKENGGFKVREKYDWIYSLLIASNIYEKYGTGTDFISNI